MLLCYTLRLLCFRNVVWFSVKKAMIVMMGFLYDIIARSLYKKGPMNVFQERLPSMFLIFLVLVATPALSKHLLSKKQVSELIFFIKWVFFAFIGQSVLEK